MTQKSKKHLRRKSLIWGALLLVLLCAGGLGIAFKQPFILSHFLGQHADHKQSATVGHDAQPKTEKKPTKRILYYRNPMGLADISQDPKKDSMGMDYIPVYEEEEEEEGTVLKLTPGRIQKSGVRTEIVRKRVLSETIRLPGLVRLDVRRTSLVTLRFDAFIEQVAEKTTGEYVRKGEPLMTIYGEAFLAAAARLKTELKYPHLQKGQEKKKGGRTALTGARRQLENLQVPKDVVAEIERTREIPQTLSWPAPHNGIIMERMAIEGMRVKPGDVLFKLADLSVIWIDADISEADLKMVHPGQQARIRTKTYPGRIFEGKVSVIHPEINMETRTAQLRIELQNPDHALLPNMYADVEITMGDQEKLIAVPNSAVIDSGHRQIAIIALGEGRFEPRDIKLGRRSRAFVEVQDGIKEGEKVVVSANFLIDAESNLRAALESLSSPEKVQ